MIGANSYDLVSLLEDVRRPITEDLKEKLIEEKGYNYSDKELKLLSHIDVDVLKKLTIDKVCKWRTGDMIAWHRKLFHCSDNFPLYGPKRKTALVLFLNRDD